MSFDHGLQVYLQTHSIMASECISKFTRSQCGESVELEGWQPIINAPPHLAWFAKRLPERERIQFKHHRKRMRRYEGIPGHDEPHMSRGSTKARQECMRPLAGKDRMCIWYNEMKSIYPGVFQIYTACRWVHLHFSCISVCIYIERLW